MGISHLLHQPKDIRHCLALSVLLLMIDMVGTYWYFGNSRYGNGNTIFIDYYSYEEHTETACRC